MSRARRCPKMRFMCLRQYDAQCIFYHPNRLQRSMYTSTCIPVETTYRECVRYVSQSILSDSCKIAVVNKCHTAFAAL